MLSIGAEDAICKLWDGGLHVGDTGGARIYGAELPSSVEGLLSRACRRLLVKAGSGVATFGIPGSAGGSGRDGDAYAGCRYNDLASVEAAFAAHPDQIACVILDRWWGMQERFCRSLDT